MRRSSGYHGGTAGHSGARFVPPSDRLEHSPHPVAARAKGGETKTRLVPDPDAAAVVAETFHLWADRGLGCKAIADHLNRPGGPPSPSHVDSKRNVRGHWAKSSLRAMLRNPTYTGRLVWNRLDFATQREAGGTARLRAEEEWVVSEVEHLPLVSDELFGAAQERFRQRPRSNGRVGSKTHLFTGMVRCASGHQPLAMYGRTRKEHTYMTCDYGRTYGKVAADQLEGHGQWLSIREDALLPLVAPTTSSTGASRSPRPSLKRSPTPSRKPKTSRRRSQASLKET